VSGTRPIGALSATSTDMSPPRVLCGGESGEPIDASPIKRAIAERRTYEAPPTWNIGHVDYRLVGAFEALLRLPITTRPKAYGNSMPAYMHDFSDLVAQEEGVRELTRARKRLLYRHRGATAQEVAQMEEALAWPLKHLKNDADAARATLSAAFWKAINADYNRRVARMGISRRTFFRHRKRGLEGIVAGLTRERVVVR
jgi:hypothetical protein